MAPIAPPALVLALVGTALAASACSASTDGAASSAPAVAESSSSAASAPDSGSEGSSSEGLVGSDAGSPDAAPGSASIAKPSAADMPTDRLADAVLEQLKIDSPDTFSDQLITIALSPLMRQFSSTAEVTTRVASKGEKVTFTISGDDGTCVITVTDEPRARGVVCKTV